MASELIERVRPFLEPGEQAGYAFSGETGVKPSWRWFSFWLIVANRPRIIVVTDRRIIVLAGGQLRWNRTKPKKMLASVPRETRLEHGQKHWSKVAVAGQKIWLGRNCYALLDRANADAYPIPVVTS